MSRDTDTTTRLNKEMIKKNVNELFKHNKTDVEALAMIRSKHGDEAVVDAIFDSFKDLKESLEKKANRFKELILTRYSKYNLSKKDLIKKALKYKKNHPESDINDSTFNYFMNLVLNTNTSNNFSLPNTQMSQTMGHGMQVTASKLRVPADEMDVLQDILKIAGESRVMHSNVVLQTMAYEDCAAEALCGRYDAKKDDPYSFVHPIVAALFLPKVKVLEETMLLSNIGEMIKRKHEGKQIQTKPNFDLYWNIVTDPNGIVCDTESSIKDLRNRANLQTKLYDAVLNLRNGRYYNQRMGEFLNALNMCQNNIYDAADLTFVRDEGTMIRRLLGAFSLRPTTVTTTPLFGTVTSNPQIDPRSLSNITHVPMITMRLPVNAPKDTTVNLKDTISQAQWYVENRALVPKTQNIVMSREVLFFYVGRRYQTINYSRMSHPYNFSNLPLTVSGTETLNDTHVQFDETITLGDEKFCLRSVVFVESAKNMKNIVTGCTAGIVLPADLERGILQNEYVVYDPYISTTLYDNGTSYDRVNPVHYVNRIEPLHAPNVGVADSFYERASKRGTVFMYVRKTD